MESKLNKVSLVLPTLNPCEKIFTVVENAKNAGFSDIIIVNDGSRPEKNDIFDKLAEDEACTVLVHEVNKGKGRGLKTAFNYFLENRPESLGVVTIDDDGQHATEDIVRCAEKMTETGNVVFGCRDFSLENVPPKSRFGNKLTSFVFATGVGLKISDTQTGLRAIPTEYIEVFTSTEGERFEYETNMLIDMKRHGIPFDEVKIRTLYDDGNSGTHFRPIVDSVKIYSRILKYTGGSILSFLIDIALFYIFVKILGDGAASAGDGTVLLSTFLARLFSSLFNFFYNRRVVFKKGNLLKSAIKYYALCICQTAVSALAVSGLIALIKNSVGAGFATVLKVIVDAVLFIISYFIQKKWVYR